MRSRRRPGVPGSRRTARIGNSHYLMAALAPASSSFFLIVSASAFGMPSLTVEGAPSTKSFASFKPNPVISRMTLMTPTLLAPNSVIVTVNSVCASAAGAAAAPAPARSRCDGSSRRDAELLFHVSNELDHFHDGHLGNGIEDFVFRNSHYRLQYIWGLNNPESGSVRRRLWRRALLGFKNSSQRPYQLRVGSSQRTDELTNRRLEHTQQLRQRLRARGQ